MGYNGNIIGDTEPRIWWKVLGCLQKKNVRIKPSISGQAQCCSRWISSKAMRISSSKWKVSPVKFTGSSRLTGRRVGFFHWYPPITNPTRAHPEWMTPPISAVPIWKFPEIGVTLVIIHFRLGFFYYKPSSYWVPPKETPISRSWKIRISLAKEHRQPAGAVTLFGLPGRSPACEDLKPFHCENRIFFFENETRLQLRSSSRSWRFETLQKLHQVESVIFEASHASCSHPAVSSSAFTEPSNRGGETTLGLEKNGKSPKMFIGGFTNMAIVMAILPLKMWDQTADPQISVTQVDVMPPELRDYRKYRCRDFHKWRYPKWMVYKFIREHPLKWTI